MLYRLEKRPSWALFLLAECSAESGWRMSGVHKLIAKGGFISGKKRAVMNPIFRGRGGVGRPVMSCPSADGENKQERILFGEEKNLWNGD